MKPLPGEREVEGKRILGVRLGFELGWDQGMAVAGGLGVGVGLFQGGAEWSQSNRPRG